MTYMYHLWYRYVYNCNYRLYRYPCVLPVHVLHPTYRTCFKVFRPLVLLQHESVSFTPARENTVTQVPTNVRFLFVWVLPGSMLHVLLPGIPEDTSGGHSRLVTQSLLGFPLVLESNCSLTCPCLVHVVDYT